MHPIIKSPYLFCEARSLIQGAGFILATDSPFDIGRVLTFKDNSEYLTSMAQSNWPVATVPGYMILIQFAGGLTTGTRIEVQETTHRRIEKSMEDMAKFFYWEKIDLHAGYYKKFLIK